MKSSKFAPRGAERVGITVVKKVPAPFSLAWIRDIVSLTLTVAGHRRGAAVGLVFTSDSEIRALNRRYRGKDCPTDVLAFRQDEDGDLGDIVISMPFTRRRAKLARRSLRREVADLIIHGTLHLLGHDHKKKTEMVRMFLLQDRVMARADYRPIDDKR